MSNILSEVHPELVAEWSDKNLPLTPDRITYGSNKVVWWKGACGHEWQTSVKARSNGENCPICSGARVIEGVNDLATLKPELADEWSSKNDPLKPTMVTTGSHKKVIWRDKYGHEWTATVKSRALNGTGCPYCSHNKILLDDKGISNEERSEYIATLQTSLEKLTFLTNSLIKMSRLESGIISLKPEKNSLNDIVLQAVKTVYAKAKEKNITITFDCEQNFEAMLDFNWTAEAITNVLDNAVKYTPSGGVVELKITEYPSYLRLDISDNGVGIPEEEQAKIFGRFYRGKQSAGIDGVGIGLYLTRDIINKQKGYIKVASDENGSIFSLFLQKD